MEVIKGKVWKFGDNINTDVIYPGRYMKITDPEETAKHCFETVYPEFMKEAKPGDIIVAGKYFGCGSSREQAVTCLKYFGVGAVVAESFARIYYRNAINVGLPIVVCLGITKKVEKGDIIEINLEKGEIKNERTGEIIKFEPLPDFVLQIFKAGGLIPYIRKKLGIE